MYLPWLYKARGTLGRRTRQDDTIWMIKLQLIDMLNLTADTDDPYNFGIFLPKAGRYVDEQSELRRFGFPDNVRRVRRRRSGEADALTPDVPRPLLARARRQVYFEFRPKQRQSKEPEKVIKAINTKKHQKQFYELQTKRDHTKMSGMLSKGFDPNFHYDSNGSLRRR